MHHIVWSSAAKMAANCVYIIQMKLNALAPKTAVYIKMKLNPCCHCLATTDRVILSHLLEDLY